MIAMLITAHSWGLYQLHAQEAGERRAVVAGSGQLNQGSCTIEVLLTGSVEIEIHGDRAILRGPAAQTAQWQRFTCNGILPPNPAEFHFTHAAGRGRQQLIRDPRLDGGVPAVIRIKNPRSELAEYSFTITWKGRFGDTSRSWRPRS